MDPYQILGLRSNATPDEVSRRHRELCKIYHPDVSVHDKEFSARKFKEIHAAYEAIISGAPLRSPARSPSRNHKSGTETTPRSADIEAMDALVGSILLKHKIPAKAGKNLDLHQKRSLVFYDWAGGSVIDRPISFQRDGGPVVYFDWSRATMSAINVLRKWNSTFPSLAVEEGHHAGRPKVVAAGVLDAMRTLKNYHDGNI